MTEEESFFIQILKNHIIGEASMIPEIENWDEILMLSQSHQVTGIIFAQCKDVIPKSLLPIFRQAYSVAFYYYANRVDDMEHLFKELEGIPVFSVKGLEIAKYYPVPALRTMGDCDIVVTPENVNKTIETMLEAEFDNYRVIKRDAEYHFEKDGMVYELHCVLAKSYENANQKIPDFFNDFMPYVKSNQLDWSFHLLFLLYHIRKHFRAKGVGIRQFMDIAVIIQKEPELNWKWIEEKLKFLEMMPFASCCFSLIEEWFGICVPIDYERIDQDFLAEITEWILSNGAFGFDNMNYRINQENITFREYVSERGPLWKKRLKLFCKDAFPAYRQMILSPNYRFLRGKPFLLPFAWLKRILLVLTGRRNKELKQLMSNVMMPTSEIEMKKEFYEKLGL